MTGVGKLLWHLLDCNVQVLGHLVTYSILAYLIAALVVYFRLLPSARDRKDQLVSGSPVKQKSNNVPAGSFPALLGHALAHLHPQKVSHLVVPQVDKTFLKLFTFNYRVSQKNLLSESSSCKQAASGRSDSRRLESDLPEAACLQDDDSESKFFWDTL